MVLVYANKSNCFHFSSFALDSRWSTIHTVCFDLLNSPEDWEMKDQNLPLSALSNLCKGRLCYLYEDIFLFKCFCKNAAQNMEVVALTDSSG